MVQRSGGLRLTIEDNESRHKALEGERGKFKERSDEESHCKLVKETDEN